MAQLLRPVDPFGEVNVHPQRDGSLRIVATILMEPDIEGARCGLALDASASMKKLYGANSLVSPLFKKASGVQNDVEPVARMMAAYLARFSSSGTVNLVYWACNADGSGIEEIGEVNERQAESLPIGGPRKLPWGRNTRLLPPVRHFVDGVFRTAPWAIALFITDGYIDDMPEVKQYCQHVARQIAAGTRSFVKLVLIGLGEQIDEKQLTELDDMFDGSDLRTPAGDPIDLWDHKLALQIDNLHQVFAEVVSESITVAEHGRILDSAGRVAANYSDGLPAMLRFTLPRGSRSFTLELNGQCVTQDLSEVLGAV